jgi:phosphoribosyl-ATP pyrophosphohydrolase/phosphoribosyl-AMP cyclohydrolase
VKNINFTKQNGLVPAIIQDEKSGEIYMLGFMNEEAFEKTQQTGLVYFWSRSKKRLWMKGETSGNKLQMKKIFVDCDNDSILIKVKLIGKNVCHTGSKTCFSTVISNEVRDLISNRISLSKARRNDKKGNI